QRLAGRNREAYAIDGAQRAGIGEELRLEVAHLQHRRGRRAGGRWLVHRLPYRLRDRGSSQSRMPSPRKLNPSTTERMARPGNVATPHCSISSRPSDTIEPHSGVGGTTPRPRNDKPAKVIMALPTSSVTSTISGPTALGTIWRSTMRAGLSPITIAA